MVQMVENWAWLTCRLARQRAVDGRVELDIVVEQVAPADHFPNLFSEAAGQTLTIALKVQPPELAEGARFTIKARRAGPGMVWGDAATLTPLD